MSNPNDPSGPPHSEQPDPTQPPADPGHSPASPPAWQQQPQEQPPQQQGPWLQPEQPQQPPNQGWEQQPGWGQQPPPPPGGWPPPQQQPQQQQQPPQGAQAWDQPTQAIGWSQQPQQQGWDQQAPQPTQVWGQEPQQPSWQPPGYPGGEPGRTRSRALPLILIGVVVLLLAVGAFLAFVTPGFAVKKVFDASAVQTGVTTVLTSDYKLSNVTGVTCPAQQEVKVGATFTCTASVDGRNRTVQITVKTSDGSYEVGRPT